MSILGCSACVYAGQWQPAVSCLCPPRGCACIMSDHIASVAALSRLTHCLLAVVDQLGRLQAMSVLSAVPIVYQPVGRGQNSDRAFDHAQTGLFRSRGPQRVSDSFEFCHNRRHQSHVQLVKNVSKLFMHQRTLVMTGTADQ